MVRHRLTVQVTSEGIDARLIESGEADLLLTGTSDSRKAPAPWSNNVSANTTLQNATAEPSNVTGAISWTLFFRFCG